MLSTPKGYVVIFKPFIYNCGLLMRTVVNSIADAPSMAYALYS